MEFKLPEIGEGLQEGELIRWLVKVGDSVNVDQPLLEVMTDKATVEVPATEAGTIKELKANEGDMIKIGQVIALIEAGATQTSSTPKVAEKIQEAVVQPEVQAEIIRPTETMAPITETKRSPVSPNPAGPYQSALETLNSSSIPAAPIVRAMARDAGVNLAEVQGSGPNVGGIPRVLEEDLLKYLNQKSNAPSAAVSQKTFPAGATQAGPASTVTTPVKQLTPATKFSSDEIVERKPLRGLRRLIAQGMVKSKYTAPHYSYVDEFECSDLIKFREQAKEVAESYGIKFSYLPFVIKAVVAALKEFPIVNSTLEDTANGQELVYKKFYHIGFAVATDEGLIVPVIKHADQKSLLQIAKELVELSDKVRAGKATADELKGSTFTITSMGNLGGIFAMPIINYPEAGILGVYKIQEKPIVQKGQIVVGNMMTLSLSLDHRIVDGAVGSKFCSAIINRLANPAKLLLENF
ncbi:MAG: 2-oxo acid dehydrogenase subunit E2 [Proteobacteria bacterium]|nr:2-oxo acid dehydrogenase subunit E2 [Pseudomonadota bacterium]